MCNAPVLRFPNHDLPFKIQTDACEIGLGAVLCQEYDDGEHPVLYISRLLSEAERKWDTREKEALGVLWACEEFRPYIGGRNFTVETDHESLRWLLETRTAGRLARWALRLQEFLPQMKIVHRAGSKNGNADSLSRNPVSFLSGSASRMSVPMFKLSQEITCGSYTSTWPDEKRMSEAQKDDEWCRRVIGSSILIVERK